MTSWTQRWRPSLLGVSARAIRKAVAAGRLRIHGTARRVLVSLDEVLDVHGDLLNLR